MYRRQFLKIAVAGIGTLSGASVLAGCAGGQSSSSLAMSSSSVSSTGSTEPLAENSSSASSSDALQRASAENSNPSTSTSDVSEADSASDASGANGASDVTDSNDANSQTEADDAAVSVIAMQANGTTLQVTLADTEAASALVELLREGPVSVDLHPYGGFEHVGSLPEPLPTSDRQVTTSPGDVMLYQGNQISVFHGVNAWAYTPLGHIEGATAESLLDVLGEGDVTIELSLI